MSDYSIVMDELDKLVSEISAMSSSFFNKRYELGGKLLFVQKKKIFQEKFKQFVNFLQDKSEGFGKYNISHQTAYKYILIYKAFSLKGFREWFDSDFQELSESYGYGFVQPNDVIGREFYKVVRKYKNDKRVLSRKLKIFCREWLEKRTRKDKVFLKRLEALEEEELAISYDQGSVAKDDIPVDSMGLLEAPPSKPKRFFGVNIDGLKVRATFRGGIRISNLDRLISVNKRFHQLSIDEINAYWEREVLPVINDLNEIILSRMRELGHDDCEVESL